MESSEMVLEVVRPMVMGIRKVSSGMREHEVREAVICLFNRRLSRERIRQILESMARGGKISSRRFLRWSWSLKRMVRGVSFS